MGAVALRFFPCVTAGARERRAPLKRGTWITTRPTAYNLKRYTKKFGLNRLFHLSYDRPSQFGAIEKSAVALFKGNH